ncbi:hypothetical protein AALA22_15130 [Anaerovoracaceae bacterium 41-7]
MSKYIDVENLVRCYERDWKTVYDEEENEMVKYLLEVFRKLFTKIIDITPAANVEEVKHATWVWNPDGINWGIDVYECSLCGYKNHNTTQKEKDLGRTAGFKFCPSCGAKMQI